MAAASAILEWKAEGRAEGFAEGLAARLREARREDLLKPLRVKFHSLPPELSAAIRTPTTWMPSPTGSTPPSLPTPSNHSPS